jgi:hypothetical protein
MMKQDVRSANNFIAPTFSERIMLMPRKPALVLSLLNLMLKPRAGQTKASSNQHVALPQHPPAHDHKAWRAYWKAQGQSWRTEPEIDRERQAYLARRRSILTNIEQGIYPFKDVKLNRADVEWLLATHENGRGPIDWGDESQRERVGLDLRGADLCQINLSGLLLARTWGGLPWEEWTHATKVQRDMAVVFMQGANLRGAHLENADLRWAFLEEARLRWAHLGNADLRDANLKGAHLRGVSLTDKMCACPQFADAHWDNVNLALVDWSQVTILGEQDRRSMG